MAHYKTGIYNLGGVSNAAVTALADANSAITFNLVGAANQFIIRSNANSTVTVNDHVGVADTLKLVTNGGTITIANPAAAPGQVTAMIDGGGQIVVADNDIGMLNNASIGFGAGGGSLVMGKGDTPGRNATAIGAVPASAIHYTVTGAGTVQTISTLQAERSLRFETVGANLATGMFKAAEGSLRISADGFGGTDITVCFLEGTAVATPDGHRCVESIKAGDLVSTVDGRAAPVRWVGVGTVCTAFADALRTMPVRIRASALDDNVPCRDLLVSPRHAMFLDGALVQASALVNDTSIVRETRMPRTFRYYHIELQDNALILAEGAATETFIDAVDRTTFDNWAEHVARFGYGDEPAELELPRARTPRQVPPATRDRLAARARALAAAGRAVLAA